MGNCLITRKGESKKMKDKAIALYNNDSKTKKASEVYSNVLTVDSTETIVNYYLFAYTFSSGFPVTSAIQGSNDSSTWTSLYELRITSHIAQTFYSAVKGYKYYRLYSKCAGDDYSPRSTTVGIASVGEISFTKGND